MAHWAKSRFSSGVSPRSADTEITRYAEIWPYRRVGSRGGR